MEAVVLIDLGECFAEKVWYLRIDLPSFFDQTIVLHGYCIILREEKSMSNKILS